ncbi:3-dehydroquinate synthase [Bacillus sp. FJAT-49736]|uniref:3-dehydroquinate synthase n=1 Tax=Bacillus sp. FJAT-49736 TaxID=2833582 RepID=UPI001BC91B9A|nr:3-dehydroquinate synthase [Bacillus sp. FJAT-49736]MBS4173274.1 3-dehydroquinate synthase [Bacillus sp. FJAT-49736]
MDIINICTSSKDYSVYIGNKIIHQLTEKIDGYSKILIITNKHLETLHLQTLKSFLPTNKETHIYIAPNGEKAKTFQIYEDCISFTLQNGFDRKSVILSFGGGSIGDLAGFVAATYMRGIPFIQIPTTLLAHDSAIGGKVAINHPLGKNMIGSFYQPELVIFDIQFLETLPITEKRSGFAEVIKEAIISDPQFLQYLMKQVQTLDSIPLEILQNLLRKGIEIKANIVQLDEKEQNIRAYLNFGHTLGHALEANAGYGMLTHGEAVLIGIVYALHLSKELFQLPFPMAEFINWLEGLGYEWRIPADTDFDAIFELMARDKKSVHQTPNFVLLTNIGQPVLKKVDKDILRKTFHLLQNG